MEFKGVSKVVFILNNESFNNLKELSVLDNTIFITYKNNSVEVNHEGKKFVELIKKQKTVQIISEMTYDLILKNYNNYGITNIISQVTKDNIKKIYSNSMQKFNKHYKDEKNETYEYYLYEH